MHELTNLQFEISRAPKSCAELVGDSQRPLVVGKGGDQIELFSLVSNPGTTFWFCQSGHILSMEQGSKPTHALSMKSRASHSV